MKRIKSKFNLKEKIKNKNASKRASKHKNEILQNDLIMLLYLSAIDTKSRKEIDFLFRDNKKGYIEKDIVFELYNYNKLNYERFEFIIESCTKYLKISSCLIRALMKDNNKE